MAYNLHQLYSLFVRHSLEAKARVSAAQALWHEPEPISLPCQLLQPRLNGLKPMQLVCEAGVGRSHVTQSLYPQFAPPRCSTRDIIHCIVQDS